MLKAAYCGQYLDYIGAVFLGHLQGPLMHKCLKGVFQHLVELGSCNTERERGEAGMELVGFAVLLIHSFIP